MNKGFNWWPVIIIGGLGFLGYRAYKTFQEAQAGQASLLSGGGAYYSGEPSYTLGESGGGGGGGGLGDFIDQLYDQNLLKEVWDFQENKPKEQGGEKLPVTITASGGPIYAPDQPSQVTPKSPNISPGVTVKGSGYVYEGMPGLGSVKKTTGGVTTTTYFMK